MEEEWRDVIGYEGYYQVSNFGNIKSLRKNIIMNQLKNESGYCYVNLTKDKIIKKKKVHRLVAIAFIPNIKNKETVNHKNEIKDDNCVSNLEWMTAIENSNYGTARIRQSKKVRKQICQLSKNNEFIKLWDSAYHVKRELGYDDSFIRKCANKKIETAYKCKWEFV